MLGIVLAGGENRRYPSPKAFIEAGGQRLIERNLGILRSVCGDVAISTNSPELYFYLRVPMFGDLSGRRGPMGGLQSAFYATEADAVFVAACDMPFISSALAGHMVEAWQNSDADALVPLWAGRPEPLLAIYRRTALGHIDALLAEGRYAMQGLLERLRVQHINEQEVAAADPDGGSFVNINTPEDYRAAFGERDRAPLKN